MKEYKPSFKAYATLMIKTSAAILAYFAFLYVVFEVLT